MKVIGPNGVQEVWRFPGTSSISLAIKILTHPTYTVIVCESDDWYSDLTVEVDNQLKVLRIKEKK